MIPTKEQVNALDVFGKGQSMVLEALAGTGKTSTLRLIAESAPNRRGRYIAFNTAIVAEAKRKMPGSCPASTAHSLAYQAVGKEYAHRLNGPRMRSGEIARRLGMSPIFLKVGDMPKVLQPGYLGGLVMRTVTNFCQSADNEPGIDHVPYVEGIDLKDDHGFRTYVNNDHVARAIQPFVQKAWEDLLSLNGELRYSHSAYLKTWQLGNPRIFADYILLDEAQDTDPVLTAVLDAQDCQKIFVGDRFQEVYAWRGAVDAISRLRSEGVDVAYLTGSFRFGAEIAEVANDALDRLQAEIRIKGLGGPGTVGRLEKVDCILTRTNATAVSSFLGRLKTERPHLLGGGKEVLAFAEGARDLKEKGFTSHPELACFQTWGEVQAYLEQDELGGELKLLVELVDKFGADVIANSIKQMTDISQASTIISTAHKAKGKEFASVKLASDFPPEPSSAEMKLLYVAVTRAQINLDCESTVLSREKNVQPELAREAL